MNFIDAVKVSKETNAYVRRKGWADGIAMFIAKPKSKDDKSYKYSAQSLGKSYIATCHVAACELAGVREMDDILADDWEIMYP